MSNSKSAAREVSSAIAGGVCQLSFYMNIQGSYLESKTLIIDKAHFTVITTIAITSIDFFVNLQILKGQTRTNDSVIMC